MKQLLILLSISLIVLTACKDDQEIIFYETGVVVDYAGAGSCGFVIELKNGKKIQPMYYPKEHTFSNGQRVLVEYVELNNIINSCNLGTICEIKAVEELACAPYIDLYFDNYDSLARDPILVHEAFLDGNCLYFKLSYSGGCKEHTIDLARMHPWTASSATVPTFEIRHNANGDLCKAYFTREFRFDLSELKREGKKEFVLTAKQANGKPYNKLFRIP